MTQAHIAAANPAWIAGLVNDDTLRRMGEIEANIRSQVESGMTGRTRLTFAAFREVSQERAKSFPSAKGQGWILAQWGNALAGEIGEACNIIKKIDREDFTLDEARDDLADELADAFTYLDLLANNAGIDLEAAVVRKFNIVSERRGLPHRIEVQESISGRYNPETHVVVERADLDALLAGAVSMVGDAKNYSICVSVSTILGWLTP